MAVAEVKNDSDRNKMIIAIILGVVALLFLIYAFGGSFFGGSTAKSVTTSPTPKPSPTTSAQNADKFRMPSQNEEDLAYQSTPITYSPTQHNAPDPGRNIFAFYEPPKPCVGLECPTPEPKPTPMPTVAPTPPVFIAYVTPQSVYAGSKSFRMDIHGDKFDQTTKIYYNNSEMPTSYINGQKLSTDIPANLISGVGSGQIVVRTPDGKFFSNPVMLNVQPPPVPTFYYIGMIQRQHSNNDTAYYLEQGKKDPVTARLNDVIAGRFRLISISAEKIVVEDTSLGFKHSVNMQHMSQGYSPTGTGQPVGPGFNRGGNGTFRQVDPTTSIPGGSIPGIPDNIPRVNAPTPAMPQKKSDDEDTDN